MIKHIRSIAWVIGTLIVGNLVGDTVMQEIGITLLAILYRIGLLITDNQKEIDKDFQRRMSDIESKYSSIDTAELVRKSREEE